MTRADVGAKVLMFHGGNDRNSTAVTRLGVLLFAISLASVSPAIAAPCTTTTAACTEWISPAPGSGRSLIYRSYPLTSKNEQVTRALILVHGAGRDANNYFRTAMAAALLAGALEDTVVIAPHFASNSGECRDALAPNEINWDCGAGSFGGWRVGAAAIGNAQLSSFDLADEIIAKLASRSNFPNLQRITVAGFSAGGQYVNRYEAMNQAHDRAGVPVTYVVASPSSYAYPDPLRPALGNAAMEAFWDADNCTTFDRWPYGLGSRTGYAAKLTSEQIRNQLVSRDVTYVVGQLETPQSPALDLSCPAMAQGPSRLARALSFFKYITGKYGAKHRMLVVPQCGHNQRCVLTADAVLPLLFPTGNQTP